jgi:ABC-2 type transport system permease protein
MSTMSLAARDSVTMVRRDVRHTLRYPGTLVTSLLVPALLLLMFVGVFGGALSGAIAGSAVGAGGHYINYVVPGILLMTVGYGSSSTAIAVNGDMTEGIIARFRTMAISRSSVLTGHVVGSLLRTMVSIGLLIGVAFALGYRPGASPLEWLAAIGLLALFVIALTWLAVAVGLIAKTPAGTTPFLLIAQVLPFVSSAFVPTASMSAPVRWFAQHEPFTPVIDTLRGLLLGGPVGGSGPVAVAWCLGLALAGFFWARALFTRERNR